MSSKYVGFNHYRRYFSFLDNISEIDNIFKYYDLIVGEKSRLGRKNVRQNYCYFHICKNYDEMIEIIKDIKPEYYETAKAVTNQNYFYCCNIFIMKKDDFIRYGDFMFELLSEFDKGHNFTSYDSVANYLKNKKIENYHLQMRIQGFLSERISNIFYVKNFAASRIKKIPMFYVNNKTKINLAIIKEK